MSCDVSRIQIALELVFHWKTRRYLHFSLCHTWRHTVWRHIITASLEEVMQCFVSRIKSQVLRAMFGKGKAGVSRNHLQIIYPAFELETTSHYRNELAGFVHLFLRLWTRARPGKLSMAWRGPFSTPLHYQTPTFTFIPAQLLTNARLAKITLL